MKIITKMLAVFFAAMTGVFALALLMAFPTEWFINYVFSDAFRIAVFGVAQIDIWHALVLGVLIGSLFKSSK